MPLRISDTFAGYRILRLLGSGGMGEVYLVQHPRLPRQEALKVLRPDISSDPSFRERFLREADLAAGLRHPHIVGIHDRGEHEGHLWIAMDYIDGSDAAHLLEQKYPAGMPIDIVVPITTAVASALDYAHKKGLLHRDVKPANIIVADLDTDDASIFLADFGIARTIDDTSGITATNMTVGTVAYAAPEQLMGAPMDGRADQYALAATTYYLLTGSELFPHANPAVAISHTLNTDAPLLSETRAELADWDPFFTRALSKLPEGRYSTCSGFARALSATPFEARLHNAVTRARRARSSRDSRPDAAIVMPRKKSPSSRRLVRPTTVVATLSALTLTGALVYLGIQLSHRPPSPAVNAPAPTTITVAPAPLSSTPPPPPQTTSATTLPVVCGVDIDALEVRRAMSMVEREGFGAGGVNQAGGNFDPCSELSTVLVYPYGASVSAPRHALLFHRGTYLGTATPDPYAFIEFNAEMTTDSTVVLDFRLTPASCNACDDGSSMPVKFRWNGQSVDMVGVPPDTYRG